MILARPHLIAALITSYGISMAVWGMFGSFNLFGFVFVSAIAAGIGFLIGWLSRSKLMVTVVATAIIRVALYLYFTFLT